MLKYLLTSILLIAMLSGTYCQNTQNASGYIYDMQTHECLTGAHIAINGNKGVVSDTIGYFSIQIKKTDTIKISFMGYGILTYYGYDLLHKANSISIYMEPESFAIQEVRILPYQTYDEFKEYFKKTEVNLEALNSAQEKSDIVKMHIKKGYVPDMDSYSLYREQTLYPLLRQEGVTIFRMRRK